MPPFSEPYADTGLTFWLPIISLPIGWQTNKLLAHLTHHDLRPIFQRLCQMWRLDFLATCQICNGARQFQDVMAKKPPHLGLSEINAFVLEKVRYGI